MTNMLNLISSILLPPTLDGILHMSAITSLCNEQREAVTSIPTGLRKLWVAKHGLNRSGTRSVLAASWITRLLSRGQEFDGYALNEARDRLLSNFEGLQFTVIADKLGQNSQDSLSKQKSYHLHMVPDLSLLDSIQLHAYCGRGSEKMQPPLQYFRELNFILFKFLHDACKLLDSHPNRLVQQHIAKFTAWARLQVQRFNEGSLPLSRVEWAKLLFDQQYFEGACDRVASANKQGHAFFKTGQNLLPILKGEQEPLQFLFKDDMMSQFYNEISNNRICFDQWHRFLQAYA